MKNGPKIIKNLKKFTLKIGLKLTNGALKRPKINSILSKYSLE